MKFVRFYPIFLDIETTGLKPLEDRIVAIGLRSLEEVFDPEGTKVSYLSDLNQFYPTNTKIWLCMGDDGKYDELKEAQAICELHEVMNNYIELFKSEGKAVLLVGYNIGFDLGFISARSAIFYKRCYLDDYPVELRRAIRRSIRLAGLLRQLPRVDLMHLVNRYWLNNGRTKLKDIYSALGICNFNDCDGSEIPELAEKGEWDKIEEHLKADLRRIVDLYFILNAQELIAHNLRVRYNLFDCEVDLI